MPIQAKEPLSGQVILEKKTWLGVPIKPKGVQRVSMQTTPNSTKYHFMELALPIILRDVHIPLAIYSIMYYHSYHQDLRQLVHEYFSQTLMVEILEL